METECAIETKHSLMSLVTPANYAVEIELPDAVYREFRETCDKKPVIVGFD